MMSNIAFGLLAEIGVSILLIMTIAYCFILNNRLKKLHADKDALKQMVNDLVKATNLANTAIVNLKESAKEADDRLKNRLKEADKFAVELANHVNAGQNVIEKISKITQAANSAKKENKYEEKPSAGAALERLRQYQLRKERAA